MNDDEMARLFPRHISDESAAVLCDFLAELSMASKVIQNLIYSSTKEFLNTADNVNAV